MKQTIQKANLGMHFSEFPYGFALIYITINRTNAIAYLY